LPPCQAQAAAQQRSRAGAQAGMACSSTVTAIQFLPAGHAIEKQPAYLEEVFLHVHFLPRAKSNENGKHKK